MLSFGEVPSVSRREEVREKALQDLQRFDVLMVDGHFDYGNGYHGRVYLNPHQLFRRPSTVWRFAQDLIDVLPPEFVSRTEIVAGPATGGSLFHGQPSREGIDVSVVRLLSGREPCEAAILPIRVGGRVVNLLYVDNGDDPLAASSLAALGALCDSVSAAYVRLISDRRRRHC